MGIKVIKDFQQGDDVVIRLQFEGAISLTDNFFNVTLTKDPKNGTEYDVGYSANTNGHPNDNIVNGIINLVVPTSGITSGIYLYSITRTDADGYLTTIARSGLNSVETVECKKKL